MIHDREERKKPEIKTYSDAYYNQQERRLKVKYGNVNDYDQDQILIYKKKINRQLLKARIRQNRKAIKGLKKHLQLIDQITPQIKKSIELNKKKHPNYLEL